MHCWRGRGESGRGKESEEWRVESDQLFALLSVDVIFPKEERA